MKIFIYICMIVLCMMNSGCKKSYLNVKPDKSMLVPQTLDEFLAIVDNSQSVMNFTPFLGTIGSDDVFITDNAFSSATVEIQNSYTWAADVYQGTAVIPDWNRLYQQVFYANVVLDGLAQLKINKNDESRYNLVKGIALFERAMAFYHLSQEFCLPYKKTNAKTTLGIPLRLNSNVNESVVRGTVQQTYNQIIDDLQNALNLLPEKVSYKTRPNKVACMAMLARTYLVMEDYKNAQSYAKQAYDSSNTLLDYNSLNPAASYPLPASLPNGNVEVLYHSTILINATLMNATSSGVSEQFYQSYLDNDLRQKVFFTNRGNGLFSFKGSYSGNVFYFSGLAVDEVYLILAECLARNGNVNESMDMLNSLLQKRYKTGSFIPLLASSINDAITKILSERRKELIFRGLRWSDLRRLNSEPNYATTIIRRVKGETFTLEPNSLRYVYPIPDIVVNTSGIIQNERK